MRLMVQYLDTTLKTDEPEKLHEHTQAMIDQIDAMSSIAEAFSRFSEMPEYKRGDVDLCDLMNRSAAMYPDLPISLQQPHEAVFAFVDRELMVRVLNNLVKNASQAIPEGRQPQIEIGVKEDGKKALLWVKDNGTGIPKDEQEKIFEPSFTTKTKGMGMGLAIVRTIIEGLNGKIWFETEEGKGTTFFMRLPKTE
jgi:signal transduction histidine kinase